MSTGQRGDNLRADAQRNLANILAAATAIFAEQGDEASVAAVAERAGVGTATEDRRFPTKDDLLAAIVAQRFRRMANETRRATAIDDPEEVLRRAQDIGVVRWDVTLADLSLLLAAVGLFGQQLHAAVTLVHINKLHDIEMPTRS